LSVTEDSDVLRSTSAYALTTNGYRVIETLNGEDAFTQLPHSCATDAARINLVLCDVYMPGLGGQASFRAVQARGFPASGDAGRPPVEPELQALQAEGCPDGC